MKNGKEYIVISPFRDLQDKNKQFPDGRIYAIGDIYSNKGRIDELSTNKNKTGKQLIKIVESKASNSTKSEVKQESNVIVYDDVTKGDIAKLLSDKGIDFNKRDSKQELYDLLLGSE